MKISYNSHRNKVSCNMWFYPIVGLDHKILISIVLFSLIVVFCSCNESSNRPTEQLTPKIALDSITKMSPENGAAFYKENRGRYNFLDQLYQDSIVPALKYCNYYELKQICHNLQNTPCHDLVLEFFQTAKEVYAESIRKEIKHNSELEKSIFKKTIIPSIEMGTDSLLNEDIEDVFNKYAGGFMNYRKLNFLFGRNKTDFKNMFWEKIDTAKYQTHIRAYIQAYLDTICSKQNAYCLQIINKNFNHKMTMTDPMMRIGLTKSTLQHIQKYTSGQTDEILMEAVKDYVVPLALAGATGGVSTLYDIGSTVYDVKVTIDDIKAQKIDPDDMVKYVCAHDLSYQIENFYIPQCEKRVNEMIDNANKELYEFIISNL